MYAGLRTLARVWLVLSYDALSSVTRCIIHCTALIVGENQQNRKEKQPLVNLPPATRV